MKNSIPRVAWLVVFLSPLGSAEVPKVVIAQNFALPGVAPPEIVTSIGTPATNGLDRFAVVARSTGTNGPHSYLWGGVSGGAVGVLRTTQTIGTLAQTDFGDDCGVADSGSLCYRATVNDLASSALGLSSIWLDSTPLAVEGKAIAGLPGRKFGAVDSPSISRAGVPHFTAQIRDAASDALLGVGLFLGTNVQCIAKSGDLLPGFPGPLALDPFVAPPRFSANGLHWIAVARILLPSQITRGWIVRDGAIVPSLLGAWAEGQALAVTESGLNGAAIEHLTDAAVDDLGRFAATGDTTGSDTADDFVAVNGKLSYVEVKGTNLGLPVGPATGVRLTGGGDVSYLSHQATIANPFLNSVVFFGDRLTVGAGLLFDLDGDGVTDPELFFDFDSAVRTAEGSGFIRGRYNLATWPPPGIYQVLLRVATGCARAERVGVGCPGANGVPPLLFGVINCGGTGSTLGVTLIHALPGATHLLAIAPSVGEASLGGGCTLNLLPPLAAFGILPISGDSPTLSLNLTPAVSGLEVSVQEFASDPGAPLGFVATNAVTIGVR